jgi:hypothetical protein
LASPSIIDLKIFVLLLDVVYRAEKIVQHVVGIVARALGDGVRKEPAVLRSMPGMVAPRGADYSDKLAECPPS